MTATTQHRPLTTALGLWWAIPGPVRTALRARVPLDARDHGGGPESLIVAVGSGIPLRWLQVKGNEDGTLAVRLWEVRQRVKELAAETSTADGLTQLLLRWGSEYGLGAETTTTRGNGR